MNYTNKQKSKEGLGLLVFKIDTRTMYIIVQRSDK